eukprot:g39170.t1
MGFRVADEPDPRGVVFPDGGRVPSLSWEKVICFGRQNSGTLSIWLELVPDDQGAISCFKDAGVGTPVLPADAKNVLQIAMMKCGDDIVIHILMFHQQGTESFRLLVDEALDDVVILIELVLVYPGLLENPTGVPILDSFLSDGSVPELGVLSNSGAEDPNKDDFIFLRDV